MRARGEVLSGDGRRCAATRVGAAIRRERAFDAFFESAASQDRTDARVERLTVSRGAARLLRAAVPAIALAVTALATPSAFAQSVQEMATRRVLIEQAQQASNAGDHAAALQAAQNAGAIHMTPSLRLFIAEEDLALHHVSAALGDADLCMAETERDQTAANRASIMSRCRAIETQARAQAGTLTVRVADPHIPGLHVTVAGDALAPSLFGQPTVVSPGDVTVEATAEGYAPFHSQVHLAAGQSASVDVTLARAGSTDHAAQPATSAPTQTATHNETAPHDEAAPHTETTTHTEAQTQTEAPTQTEAQTESETATPQPAPESATPNESGFRITPPRIAAGAAAILGVVALGVGAGLYFDVLGTYNHCMQTGCTTAQEPRGLNDAAVGLFWGGLGVAVLGAAAFVLIPSPHESAHARIWIDPRGAAGISGVF